MTCTKGMWALFGLILWAGGFSGTGWILAQPVYLSPSDGVSGTAWDVELRAFVAGAPIISNVTFHVRPEPAPVQDFTMVVLPDTQLYVQGLAESDPSLFKDQVDWIVANRAASNIVYVSHVGDIVQNYDTGNLDEWEHAANAMYRLEDPQTTGLAEGIPYGVLPGNHDLSGMDTTLYNQFFGPAHFAGRAYYGAGADPAKNDNYYNLFEAGSMQFLHFNIMWLADMDVVGPWMQTVAAAYPDRLIFVTGHHVCGPGNPAAFSGTGQAIYDTLKSNPNFFMMQGGHQSIEGRRVDTFAGNEVHTILSNYQRLPNGGNGWLRTYRFSPANGTIEATTYSPVLDGFMDGPSEFTINKNFDFWLAPWTPVASFTNVFNASTLSTTFSAEPGVRYQWFVTSDQGRSPVRSFETEANLAPILNGPANVTVDEGALVELTFSASDPNQTPQSLDWQLNQGPSGGVLSPAGFYSWPTSEVDGPGVYDVRVVVADDATIPAAATSSVLITVNEVNQAPQLSLDALPATNAFQLVDIGSPVTLAASATDADLPPNALAYSIRSGAGPGMQLDSASGQFSWTPSAAQSGQLFPLMIEVQDNGTPALNGLAAVDLIVTENGQLALRPSISPVANSPLSSSRYAVRWPTFPGYLYQLETRSTLSANWQSLGTVRATGNTLDWGETDARQRGFFRLQLLSK